MRRMLLRAVARCERKGGRGPWCAAARLALTGLYPETRALIAPASASANADADATQQDCEPPGRVDVLALSNTLYPLRGGGTRSMLRTLVALREAGLRVAAICLGERSRPLVVDGVVVLHARDEGDAVARAAGIRAGCVVSQQAWVDLPLRANVQPGVPRVIFLRDSNDIGKYRAGQNALEPWENHAHLAAVYADAALVVANSQYIAAEYRRMFGGQCAVLYPGIGRPAPAGAGRRPPREFITGVVTNEKKGRIVAKRLAEAFGRELFLFCATAPAKPGERLPRNVLTRQMLPPQVMYDATKLMLVPSQWPEAFGRVHVEAMCRGIPVLASKIGGIPEVVRDEVFLVEDCTSVEAWRRRLGEMLEADLTALGERARVLAEQYFLTQAAQEKDVVEQIKHLAGGAGKGQQS